MVLKLNQKQTVCRRCPRQCFLAGGLSDDRFITEPDLFVLVDLAGRWQWAKKRPGGNDHAEKINEATRLHSASIAQCPCQDKEELFFLYARFHPFYLRAWPRNLLRSNVPFVRARIQNRQQLRPAHPLWRNPLKRRFGETRSFIAGPSTGRRRYPTITIFGRNLVGLYANESSN